MGQPKTMNEEEILGVLMDTADGAFATDMQGRIVAWNAAAERITGRKAAEVMGRSCCQVVQGRDSTGNLVCFAGCHVKAMAMRGEMPSHQDLVIHEEGDKELSLDFSTTLVRDDQRKLRAIVHTFRDVTERRQMETHLRQALGDRRGSMKSLPEAAERLTSRERQILKLLSVGLPTHQIANRLSISRATVRNHIQNMLNKLGVHSKLEAVVLAHQHDLK
jgi:PAS domain S-box-containing protein